MDEKTIYLLISGVIGLLTGAIGSLIAPWVNWGIENKKIKRAKRVQLIDSLKLYILKSNVQTTEFRKSYDYHQIRPFLSSELIDDIENPNIFYPTKASRIPKLNSKLLIALNEIEVEWGLDLGKGKNIDKEIYNKDWDGSFVEYLNRKSQ